MAQSPVAGCTRTRHFRLGPRKQVASPSGIQVIKLFSHQLRRINSSTDVLRTELPLFKRR